MRTWSVLSLIPWHQQDPWLMCRVWRRARRSWAQSQRKSFTLGVVWANPLPVTRLESLLRVLMSSHMVSMFAFEVTLGIRPPSFCFSFLTWTKLQWVAPREGRTVNSSTHYLRYNWSSDGAIPVLPKLASRHRLPQRVQLVGWNLVTSFESQKRSLVARSSAEAEYRADAKAPGRDSPLP